MTMLPFPIALQRAADDTRAVLDSLLPRPQGPMARLYEAMRYSALAPGKAFRAFLILETARLCGAEREGALRVAAAVEALHAYSLIHDDLPAMDNSDLRRGRPSCHKAFDEATAILAGDALLPLAFEVLADPLTHPDPAVRCTLIARLAHAGGAVGMVGGQMLDLLSEKRALSLPELQQLHALKTGALIGICCEAGAILGNAPARQQQALRDYGKALGLLFQITDDLLDILPDASTGKPKGEDAAAGKATFVTLLGIDTARQEALDAAAGAKDALKTFKEKSTALCNAVDFLLIRKS